MEDHEILLRNHKLFNGSGITSVSVRGALGNLCTLWGFLSTLATKLLQVDTLVNYLLSKSLV